MITNTVPEDHIASMDTGKITASFVLVTPATAQAWLARNPNNRRISPNLVARYVRDMDHGDWAFTGETVKFTDNGVLLDGQHRLTAVVQHGQPILMLVVRGLSRKAQDVMDTGRKRTASDMLNMHSVSNSALTAATARLILGYTSGRIKTSRSTVLGDVSNAEVLGVVDRDPFIGWAVKLGSHVTPDLPANPSAVAFVAWLGGRSAPEEMNDFLVSASQFRTDGPGDPRYTLVRRLQVATQQRERLTSVEQSWLIWRSFEAWSKGDQLKQLKLAANGQAHLFPDADGAA